MTTRKKSVNDKQFSAAINKAQSSAKEKSGKEVSLEDGKPTGYVVEKSGSHLLSSSFTMPEISGQSDIERAVGCFSENLRESLLRLCGHLRVGEVSNEGCHVIPEQTVKFDNVCIIVHNQKPETISQRKDREKRARLAHKRDIKKLENLVTVFNMRIVMPTTESEGGT